MLGQCFVGLVFDLKFGGGLMLYGMAMKGGDVMGM